MDKDNDNILYFKERPENIKKKIEKVCKASEIQANNIDIILSQCIKENNYLVLYEYLSSEIEFRGGVFKFCEEVKLCPDKLRKFLRAESAPSLNMLSIILSGLGYRIKIVES